jgi:hypothetical protein
VIGVKNMTKDKKQKLKLKPSLLEKFMDLASSLSPENLHCDGEISRAQADYKYSQIMKEWRKLEAIAGRSVEEDDVWQQWLATRA